MITDGTETIRHVVSARQTADTADMWLTFTSVKHNSAVYFSRIWILFSSEQPNPSAEFRERDKDDFNSSSTSSLQKQEREREKSWTQQRRGPRAAQLERCSAWVLIFFFPTFFIFDYIFEVKCFG